MQKVRLLSGLTISYDESEKEELEKIANFIRKYSFMFTDFENGNNNKTININEFNHLVEIIVRKFTEEESIKQSLESEDFLPYFYLSYLILKNGNTNNTLIQLPSDFTMELLLFFLSIKYYNYDVSKICNALFSNTFMEYEEIIERLRNEHRIDVYNYYLKYVSNFFEECDSSIIDNLESIIEELIQKSSEYFNSSLSQQSKLDSLKQLSGDEFDKLFKAFLGYINAPKTWFNLYEHLISNNLIKFEYSGDVNNGGCYFDSDDQKWKIYLISDGTIRTFVTFVHEFVHYVSLKQNDNINFSLIEFPSIYFENIAAEFLKDRGYEEGIIDEVLNARNANNFELYADQILQLKEVLNYKKNGPFSIEKKIEFYRNRIESMNDFKINTVQMLKNNGIDEIPDSLQTLEERSPVEIAYEEIDAKIDEFVKSGLLILNGYQYLVGSLLSFSILDTTNRKFGNENMINIANQLDNYPISSIIQLFGIVLQTGQYPSKDDKYRKKLSPSPIKDN